MSANDFIQNLTDAIFVLIFVLVAVKAARRPRRANIDTALLFGAVAIIVLQTWITEIFRIAPDVVLTNLPGVLAMALPYLLLRLVDDFVGVSRPVMLGAGIGLILAVAGLAAWSGPHKPLVFVLALVLYFVVISLYVTRQLIGAAWRTRGITQRRLRAVSAGTLCLGLVILLSGVAAATPTADEWVWRGLSHALALASGLSYFVGFAPPAWLRRTWQEPELRAFLGRAASLPRLPTTDMITRELERGAISALGANYAVIAFWQEGASKLVYTRDAFEGERPLPDSLCRRALATQQPLFSDSPIRDNPADADLYRAYDLKSVLAAPIVAGSRPLGVLGVYATHTPIFAEDDLHLVQLLADQAAVILESRALIDEAARVQAREEATRLKDDFLSAAAHDLKTPLTALIARAQLLEHRTRRNPNAPADQAGLQQIVADAKRLAQLVTELLDVGRAEQGKLVTKREEVDLSAAVRAAAGERCSPRHRCTVDSAGEVWGLYDPVRIQQLVDNLLENAVKYSPRGGEVRVRVWQEGDRAHLTVTDQGIGIPPEDLAHLFDRFHRGSNVDDRRFSGMGLGLYICKSIAEQHEGRLWATSSGPNQGSTFHVELPAGVDPSLLPLPEPVAASAQDVP